MNLPTLLRRIHLSLDIYVFRKFEVNYYAESPLNNESYNPEMDNRFVRTVKFE